MTTITLTKLDTTVPFTDTSSYFYLVWGTGTFLQRFNNADARVLTGIGYTAYPIPNNVVESLDTYNWEFSEDRSQLIGTPLPEQNEELKDKHNNLLYINRDSWRMFCHLMRNDPETDQYRLEAHRNCAQVDAIHWIYDNYSRLQSRLALVNQAEVAHTVEAISRVVANQLYTLENGVYGIHANYTTIAKAEMTRQKLKGRLERDKVSTNPLLRWNITVEDFTRHFLSPMPATVELTIASINSRGGTPATATITLVNTRPNVGSIKWQQKVGSQWDDLPGATGTSYTPPTTPRYHYPCSCNWIS